MPDVAGDADPQTGYQVYVDGHATGIGGTSAVAPLWAGLVARLAQLSGGPLGLLQPALYAGASAGRPAPGLRDITTGGNGAYRAGAGWDACTGLGVPDAATAGVLVPPQARAAAPAPLSATVRAGVLDVEIRRSGDPAGEPVVLLHGFPYDAHSFDRVAELLGEAGADVVVPSLRGYGGTRFVDPATLRSGQQAAIGHDLLELMDALGLESPVLAGYDWGGRAACVVAALWPERVSGLVLHGERGRAGLREHRAELARLLWEEWSPTWAFTEEEFEATRPAFDLPQEAPEDFARAVLDPRG